MAARVKCARAFFGIIADMKIKDLLARARPSVSFEIFPPRKDAPFAPVKEAVERLARQKPSFMSVTYGASGNASANTVEVASLVQQCGVCALAHLTCLTSSRERIADEIRALKAANVENVLCLRGDAPKDAVEPPPGCFAHAVDLAAAANAVVVLVRAETPPDSDVLSRARHEEIAIAVLDPAATTTCSSATSRSCATGASRCLSSRA